MRPTMTATTSALNAPAARGLWLADPRRIVIWTIVIGTVIRLFLAWVAGYGYGESYYLATARHFALSYFDQPPLSLWMAWATMELTGSSHPFIVRFPWIVMFIGTTWAMFRLGAELFDERAGAYAALLLNVSLVFTLSVSSWLQPDGPLMLFLLLGTLAIVRLAFGQPRSPLPVWAAAGIFFGLAMASKYHAALILAGLLVFVATTPGYRAWFFRPGMLLAALVGAVCLIPVVVWNAQNEWVSILFQGGRIGTVAGLRLDWLARSLLGQALLIGILIWPLMVWLFARGLFAGPRGDPKVWFLCCLALFPIAIFTAAALWAPLGYHFHWQAPGYLFVFPLLGCWMARKVEQGSRVPPILLMTALAGLAVLAVVFAAQVSANVIGRLMPASLVAEVEGAGNPTREMLQWNELREVLAARGLLDEGELFAVAPQWHQTGKVDVQIGDRLPVVCLCADPRNIAFGHDHRDFAGQDALIIGTDAYIPDVDAAYGEHFDTIVPIDAVDIMLGGVRDLTVKIYRGGNYDGRYPMPIGSGG